MFLNSWDEQMDDTHTLTLTHEHDTILRKDWKLQLFGSQITRRY